MSLTKESESFDLTECSTQAILITLRDAKKVQGSLATSTDASLET